jgi:hypothetical protein
VRTFLRLAERALACFWAAIGIWHTVHVLQLVPPMSSSSSFHFVLGVSLTAGGCGLFFGRWWARIVVACLMGPVVICCGGMILFLCFRGYYGQSWVPLVLGLLAAALLTWGVLIIALVSPKHET